MTPASAVKLITQQLPCRLESRAASGLDSAEGSEPPEPSWELPPELQEFSGNKGDRHALLLFKQQQQVGGDIQAGYGRLKSLESTRPILHGNLCDASLCTRLGASGLPVCVCRLPCQGTTSKLTFATLGPCRQLGLRLTLSEPSGRRLSAGGPRWISSDGASNRWVQP